MHLQMSITPFNQAADNQQGWLEDWDLQIYLSLSLSLSFWWGYDTIINYIWLILF